jgi:chromosome segregation ATPase
MGPEAPALVGSGAVAAFLARAAWERLARKSEADAATLERERDERADRHETQLEALRSQLGAIQAQLSVLLERLAFNSAEFRRIDERQNGMSIDHGRRLAQLEANIVRLQTMMEVRHEPRPT